MEIDLRGKTAIVTGAGRGIGRVIALTLAREGVNTVALDIREEELAALAGEFAARRFEGMQQVCDVTDAASVQAAVDAAGAKYGRIDILVNNAGVAPVGAVEAFDEEAWDLCHAVNLKGVFLMSRAVVPVMKAQRSGRIINASSFAAIVPAIGAAAYAASKAAIVSFTRVLAGELGPWNITVNAYAPGMIPTELNRFAEAPPEVQERLLDTLTLRRWGRPEDVANLVCFLASDLAGYITGALIDVSGGKLATQNPRLAYEGFTGTGYGY